MRLVIDFRMPGANEYRGSRGAYTGCQTRRQTGICPPPPGLSAAIRLAGSRPFGSLISMNSFELNKVLGAMLGTCLVLLALNIGANAIFAPSSRPSPATPSR